MEVDLDIVYAIVSSSRPCQPIFKVKQNKARIPPVLQVIVCYNSPYLLVIQIFYITIAKISRERSLRYFLCIQFALTTIQVNFQGQKRLEARMLPVLPMIEC